MSKAQDTLYEMRWDSYLTAKDAEADQQKLKLKQAYDAARASEEKARLKLCRAQERLGVLDFEWVKAREAMRRAQDEWRNGCRK